MVTGAVRYDNQGRVVSQYEPFRGSFDSGAFTSVANTDSTVTVYEDAPLNRVISVTPPDWYATNSTYGYNTSNINVNGLSYPVKSLRKVSVTDPEGNTSVTYTDKRGRTVLSRTEKDNDKIETGYVYDEKDRVRSILPPTVNTTLSPLAYQYQYDGADNVLKKFIPDMGWMDYLYDIRDLPTASRDSNLIDEGKWLSTIYDAYGRAIETGFNTNTPDPNVPTINYLLTATSYDQSCGQTDAIYMGKVCQTNTRILQTDDWLTSQMTYDAFGRIIYAEGNNHLDLVLGSEKDSMIYDYADNLTRNKRLHRAFGKTDTILNRNSYDHVGRNKNSYHQYNAHPEEWLCHQTYTVKDQLLQKQLGVTNLNNALQSVDYQYLENGFLAHINPSLTANDLFKLELRYDQAIQGFTDVTLSPQKNGNISQLIWQVQGSEEQTYGFKYDYLNRLTEAKSATLNNSRTSVINEDQYKTSYTYDDRGNILSLSRKGQLSNGSYGLIDSLKYDYPFNTTSNQLQSIVDQTPGISKFKGFKQGAGGNYQYDENGNLSYDPHKAISIHYNFLNLPDTIVKSVGDTIIWLYDATGQKLRKEVRTTLVGDLQIGDNPIVSDEYLADSIHSTGIVPLGGKVTFKAETKITLESGFQSTGVFHALIDSTGVSVTRQEYCNGIEYRDTELEAIYHAAGRLYFEDTIRRYEYALADHLGNQRVLFSDRDGNGFIDVNSELLQENHYYPFGLEMEGDWALNTNKESAYLYNGKEFNDDFGLGWYDYGARFYDPAIARWNAIDPSAENYYSWTPYSYGINNPIKFIDPDGRDISIYYQEAKRKKNGEVKKDKKGNIKYQTKSVQYKTGESYDGDNQFVKDTYAALDYIQTNGADQGIVSDLASDKNFTLKIQQTSEATQEIAEFGSSTTPDGKTLLFDNIHLWEFIAPSTKELTGEVGSPALLLLHELGHVQRTRDGTSFVSGKSIQTHPFTFDGLRNQEEQHVVDVIERPAAILLGDGIRQKYGTAYLRKKAQNVTSNKRK